MDKTYKKKIKLSKLMIRFSIKAIYNNKIAKILIHSKIQ